MGVSFYRIEPFEYPHENAAFETLCRTAQTFLRDLEDLRIIGNLNYQDGQMDVLVLVRRSITIIDFKDWAGTITVGQSRPWLNEDGKTIFGGSYVNPFKQVAAYRKLLQKVLAVPVLAGNDFTHINALVLFTQPIELIENLNDQFGPLVSKWFHIADWTNGIQMLRNAASPKINLSSKILDEIVTDLKAKPFVPMPGGRLVPESDVTNALIEQDFARMAAWEAEHRDEMRAEYEKAQEGWLRFDSDTRVKR